MEKNVIMLKPVIIHKFSEPMVSSSFMLLEMDVCVPASKTQCIRTSLMSSNGSFAHALCTGSCQTFDDTSVFSYFPCNTPYPVCQLSATLKPHTVDKLYAIITAASGVKDPLTGNFVANMTFGASLDELGDKSDC